MGTAGAPRLVIEVSVSDEAIDGFAFAIAAVTIRPRAEPPVDERPPGKAGFAAVTVTP
jgi:hypothetical protein